MNTTVAQILAICENTPDPAKHRHYLESLPPLLLSQRLEDLRADEQRRGSVLPPRNINNPQKAQL